MVGSVESRIRSIIEKNVELNADIGNIKLDDKLGDFGVNSISFIKIVVALEMEFGIEVEDENLDFGKFETMRGIITYVEDRVST